MPGELRELCVGWCLFVPREAVCGLVYGLRDLEIRGEIGLGESAQCTQRQLCGPCVDWSVECLAYD